MAHPEVVKYLQENKARISLPLLRQQLQRQGYPEAEITAGVAAVYGPSAVADRATPAVRQRFFDWRTPYRYAHGRSKFGHFFFGFLVVPLCFLILLGLIGGLIATTQPYGMRRAYPTMMSLLVMDGLYLAVWVYAFRYRRWIFWGMLPAAILSVFSAIGTLATSRYFF